MSTAETKTVQSEAVRRHKEFLFPAVAMYYQEPLALVRGEGFHVWDDRGNKYLDCFGGVLTVSVGHNNPKVSRGMGLMQGLELVKDRETKEPSPQAVATVFEETKRRCVLIGKGGLYGNCIRTGLMLNSTKDHVDELIEALDAGLSAV